MKLLFVFLLSVTLISCQKERFTPYVEVLEDPIDTTVWNNDYVDGGTIPNGSNNSQNTLKETRWVLTKIVTSFSTEYPNDTIEFIDNTHYTLNNGANRNYQLAQITGSTNKQLSLYFFSPFGGSHYSGQIGGFNDNEMNNIEFIDIQNNPSTIKAWFVKIN